MNKSNKKEFALTVFMLILFLIATCVYSILMNQDRTSKIVKIGVIDSLIDNNYISKYDVVANNVIVKDPLLTNHGNTVLSIIKQKNNAQIYYVSTLDSNLVSSIENIAKAIDWCVENKVDVINMSFATKEDNPILKKAIENALQKNVIIVASCINYYDGYVYPANYKGVISVSNDNVGKAKVVVKKQEYSVKLLDGSVIKASGTSCATAYVTSQIANELSGKAKEYITKQIEK